MIFFIYYFRQENKWFEYPIFILLLFIPKFFTIHNGWDMSIWLELFATLFVTAPLLAGLLVDKYFHKKVSSLVSTLVFPATYIILDLLLGLSLFGNFASIAITQFEFKSLIQLAAVTGLGGISFMVFWFSSTVATLWKSNFNIQKEKLLIKIFLIIFLTIIIFGGIYYTISIPTGNTVRIGGVSVEHKSDMWNIIDMKTPEIEAQKYSAEIQELNNELFNNSQNAVNFGAKIVVWSEANGVIYNEDRNLFMEKAKKFAKDNQVYFVPSFLVLKYDTYSAENKMIMISPEGKVEYEYEKTISWYPSESDGIIHTIDTPYGKIGGAICFDTDFPRFIRQAAKENIDILLIPKFDTPYISPGHTYAGIFRGIEGGFSTVSQVNKGTSIASDYRGNVLSYQDFATTKDRTMIVDVPIDGRKTIYTMFGDWFIFLNALFLIILTIYVFRRKG